MYSEQNLADLSEMFRVLSKVWTIEWNKNNQCGVTRTHALILDILESEGPQQPSSLADALYITTGGITGISDKLVKAGLARRVNDERDRRVVYLEITDLGRNAVQAARERRSRQLEQFFGVLSDSEVADLMKLYRKLIDHVQQGRNHL